MKNKKLILIISIIFVLIIIAGSSYAFWIWESDRGNDTNVAFTTQGKNFSCSADGGGNITSNDVLLEPTKCTDTSHAIMREIHTNMVNNANQDIVLDLWLDINSIDSELTSTNNFRWTLTDSNQGCDKGNIVGSGDFTRLESGDKKIISQRVYSSSDSDTYYLYIWLDEAETDSSTAGKTFNFSLGGECSDRYYTPNAPVLVDGLIPVKLSASGDTVTTVSENDASWYEYYEKKWANAVLVSEDTHTREYYKNNPGTEVPTSDVLAYYVWIPRYSYKVWQYSGVSDVGQEHEIDIKFIGKSLKEMATGNGEWYTHPAFSFGTKELSGIWVGKFETHHTSYQTNSASSLGCSSTSCDSTKYNGLRILPNVRPLTNNTVSSFFFASRAMETSGNDFGINPSTTDSHMMKNSEWGAVAYLSHSKYGINDEIRVNNTYNIVYNGSTRTFLTGCGAGTPNESSEAACDIQYGTVSTGSYPQSTTGNVTGIFDMSGGANEYVMGTYNNSDSYSNTSSGFTSSNPLPDAKYYDNYANLPFDGTSSTNFTKCTLATCGGHALNETKNWHSDIALFAYFSNPWFMRGGNYYNGSSAGAFFVSPYTGSAHPNNSARLVLVEE